MHEAKKWSAVDVAVLAMLAVVLLLQVHSYRGFLCDDALISMRYAENLLAGKGLVWNEGERVEGFTNPAWVLACAALGALGLDLITALRVLGVSCALLTMLELAHWGRRHAAKAWWVGPAIVACTPAVAAWAVGGLEAPLLMLSLALAIPPLLAARESAVIGAAWRAGPPLALACWTRPDAPLFVAGSAAALACVSRPLPHRLRLLGALVTIPAAAVIIQVALRLAYYGDFVPNTAHAKLLIDPRSIVAGARYVLDGGAYLAGLVVLAAFGAVAGLRDARGRGGTLLLLALLLIWTLYVVAIGGDSFPGYRHLIPAVVLAAFLSARGVHVLRERTASVPWTIATLLAAAIVSLPAARLVATKLDVVGADAWVHLGLRIGRLLARGFAAQEPVLAVEAAGAVPYASRLPCIDMLGLTDRHVAAVPVPDDARFVPAHMKSDADYVLRREPDLIMFGAPPGTIFPVFVPGLSADPRFRAQYRMVTLAAAQEALVAFVWVRLGGRAGMRMSDAVCDFPAYLLGSVDCERMLAPGTDHDAKLARYVRGLVGGQLRHDRFVGILRPGMTASVTRLPLPPGAWKGTPIPAAAAGSVEITVQGADGTADVLVTVPGAVPVELEAIRLLRTSAR